MYLCRLKGKEGMFQKFSEQKSFRARKDSEPTVYKHVKKNKKNSLLEKERIYAGSGIKSNIPVAYQMSSKKPWKEKPSK